MEYDGDHVPHFQRGGPRDAGDILVPAALGGVLTPDIAQNVQAKAIIEAANAPTDPQADEILTQTEGFQSSQTSSQTPEGLPPAYFEWAQNIQSLRWTEEEVNQRLKHIITSSYATARKLKKHRNLTWRTAAFIVALGGVANATVLRGI